MAFFFKVLAFAGLAAAATAAPQTLVHAPLVGNVATIAHATPVNTVVRTANAQHVLPAQQVVRTVAHQVAQPQVVRTVAHQVAQPQVVRTLATHAVAQPQVVRTVAHQVAQPQVVRTVASHAVAQPQVVRTLATHAVAQPQVVRTIEAAPLAVEHVTHEVFDSHPQYNFGYTVSDARSGDSKQRTESRDGDVVRGSYTVADPDGRVRHVEYTADAINGFQAEVTYDGEAGPPAIPFDDGNSDNDADITIVRNDLGAASYGTATAATTGTVVRALPAVATAVRALPAVAAANVHAVHNTPVGTVVRSSNVVPASTLVHSAVQPSVVRFASGGAPISFVRALPAGAQLVHA